MAPIPLFTSFFLKRNNEQQESPTTSFPLLQPNIFTSPLSQNISISSKLSYASSKNHARAASAPETFLTRSPSNKNLLFRFVEDSNLSSQDQRSFEIYDVLSKYYAHPLLARRMEPTSSMSSHSSPSTHSFISSRTATIRGLSVNSRFSSSIPNSGRNLRHSYSLHSFSTPSGKNSSSSLQGSRDRSFRPFSTPQPPKQPFFVPETPISVSDSTISTPNTPLSYRDDLHYRPYFGSPPPTCINGAGFLRSPRPNESFLSISSHMMEMEMMDFHRLLLLHQYRANQFELQLEDCKSTLDTLLNLDASANTPQPHSMEVSDSHSHLNISPRSRTLLLREQVHNLQHQVHWLNIALASYQSTSLDASETTGLSPSNIQEIQEEPNYNVSKDERNFKSPNLGTKFEDKKQPSSSLTHTQNTPIHETYHSEHRITNQHETDSKLIKNNEHENFPVEVQQNLREKIIQLEKTIELEKKHSSETEYALQLELAEMHRHRELLLIQLTALEKQLQEFQINIFGSPHEEYKTSSLHQTSTGYSSLTSSLQISAPTLTSINHSIGNSSKSNRLAKNRMSILSSRKKNQTLLLQKKCQKIFERRGKVSLLRKLKKASTLYLTSRSEIENHKSMVEEKEKHIQQLTAQNLSLMKSSASMSLRIANNAQTATLQKDSQSYLEMLNANTNLNQDLTKAQKENLQLKSEMLQLEHLLDDLRIQHDQLAKELSKFHSQATELSTENKQQAEEEIESEVALSKINENEHLEANKFKSLLGSMLCIEDEDLNWSTLSTNMHKLQSLIQLMVSLEVQSPSKALDSHNEKYKKSLIPQLERAAAKLQTYIKLLCKWDTQLRILMNEMGISNSILPPGSTPQDYLHIIRTWFHAKQHSQADTLDHSLSPSPSTETKERDSFSELDVAMMKFLFENLPLEKIKVIWNICAKHPMVISHLQRVNNFLTRINLHFGESSMEKIESRLINNIQQINQLQSISDSFNLPISIIGEKLKDFFIKILPALRLNLTEKACFDDIEKQIISLLESQANLTLIYEHQRGLLKPQIQYEVDIHSNVMESIALAAKLKQQLKLIYTKWKQSQEKLKEFESLNKEIPSFTSLQKAWKEVIKGVGCQLTEDPEIIAKSLVQNLYNANSNLFQLSEQINQSNMKMDAIELSFQQFKRHCRDSLRISSDSESDILESIMNIQQELRIKTLIDPSEYHSMKKLWDSFNHDFSLILGEEPLEDAFSYDDQYKYWFHSLQCHLRAKQKMILNFTILKKVHESVCNKIETIGNRLNRKKLELNNVISILDEVSEKLSEFENLSNRVSILHRLILPQMINGDLDTKLDAIENYLQELRNYREQYFQRRSSTPRFNQISLALPNVKELIGNVATMPLVTLNDKMALKDPSFYTPIGGSLEKILNDTLGQTENTIAQYFNQLTEAEAKISNHIQSTSQVSENIDTVKKSNLSPPNEGIMKELENVFEEILSTQEFTLENFERQKLLLLVKLREYLKSMTDSQCQAFIQLQANHEAEFHNLKLEYGMKLNDKERDLRRLKKEIGLLKNQLQGLLSTKDSQAYSKALSLVLSKTLKTLDRV